MRRHALHLLKLWLIRQATYFPLWVLLFIGFRPGAAQMTPEDRWHPAFKPAAPLALLVLVALIRRWLPFDPLALGTLLFILVGCLGIVLLGFGHDAIHVVYTPMAQAMLFAWIGAVAAAMAVRWPAQLFGVPPAAPRLRPAAWLLVAAAAAATGASWLLRRHEMLAGLLPFLGVIGARLALKRWILTGLKPASPGLNPVHPES